MVYTDQCMIKEVSPEFKIFPLNAFGQLLKATETLGPEVLPYSVDIQENGALARGLSNLYQGKQEGQRQLIPRIGTERACAIAINDTGDFRFSIFRDQGSSVSTSIEVSSQMARVPLPTGWSVVALAHNHPWNDIFRRADLSPESPTTASTGDLMSFLVGVKNRLAFSHFIRTPNQIIALVATAQTVEKCQKLTNREAIRRTVETENIKEQRDINAVFLGDAEALERTAVDHTLFSQLGIVVYTTNLWKKEKQLTRWN